MHYGIRQCIAMFALASVATSSVFAVAPGLYAGLMLGPATNSGSTQEIVLDSPPPPAQAGTSIANPRSNQFGSRFFIGYKMNDYAGFEGGFNFFSKVQYDTKGENPCGDASERLRDIDFVGKLSAALGTTGLDVFAKGGVAAAYITTGGGFTNEAASIVAPGGGVEINPNFCKNVYTTKIAPTVGIGASYDLNQNWVIDASWLRTMVGGMINNMDFYGIGFSYHFVDKYCGQFLCED